MRKNKGKENKEKSNTTEILKDINPSESGREILKYAEVEREDRPRNELAGSGRSQGARPERVDKEVKHLPNKKKSSKD